MKCWDDILHSYPQCTTALNDWKAQGALQCYGNEEASLNDDQMALNIMHPEMLHVP